MILTVTLSLLLSAEPSFSLGVLAVSVGVGCTLELGWDDLFKVSVLISVSVSCCVAVAKIKEKRESSPSCTSPQSLFTGTSAPRRAKKMESPRVPPALTLLSPEAGNRSEITWLCAGLHVLRPVSLLAGIVTVARIPAAIKNGLFLAVSTPLLLLRFIHRLLLLQFQLLLHLGNQTISFLFQTLTHFSHCQFYSKCKQRWGLYFLPLNSNMQNNNFHELKEDT